MIKKLIVIIILCLFISCVSSVEESTQYIELSKYNNLVNNFNSLAENYNYLLLNPNVIYKESVQTSFIPQNHFRNINELKNWLANDDTNEQKWTPSHNCCDFARELQEAAALDGYIINQERITYNGCGHRVCTAYISNIDQLYYIEPQNDQVWWCANG